MKCIYTDQNLLHTPQNILTHNSGAIVLLKLFLK